MLTMESCTNYFTAKFNFINSSTSEAFA